MITGFYAAEPVYDVKLYVDFYFLNYIMPECTGKTRKYAKQQYRLQYQIWYYFQQIIQHVYHYRIDDINVTSDVYHTFRQILILLLPLF